MNNETNIQQTVDQIIDEKGKDGKSVIPILQAIQNTYNYLPEEALKYVCEKTEIPPEQIVGVASFYSQFRMQPVGEHIIKVCVGTACHVKGAGQVYDALRRHFNLTGNEETDASRRYTIEKVSCLGCCTLAPVVQIDEITYGHVASDMVKNVVADFEKHAGISGAKKGLFRNVDGSEIQGEIRIGLGSCCVASGSEEVKKAVEDTIADTGIKISLKNVGCVGMCHQVPLVEIIPHNGKSTLYAKVKPEEIQGIIANHFKPQSTFGMLKSSVYKFFESVQTDTVWDGVKQYSIDAREKQVSDFLDRQIPIATQYRGIINPLDIEEYKKHEGFAAMKTCLTELSPEEIIQTIKDSGLRGRGGAWWPKISRM